MRGVVYAPARDALRSAMRQTLPPAPEARRIRVRVPGRVVRQAAALAAPVVASHVPPPSPRRRGWSLGKSALPQAHEAVKAAREAFPRHPEAVDAVLGWLFARFPRYGARGSDMVAHHAMLRDERYYEGWVALCAWLRLFERDR